MWINRLLEKEVLKSAKNRPAVLLTGARQTGKSSLLKKIFKKSFYITLDKFINAQEAEENPSSFLNKFENKKSILIA